MNTALIIAGGSGKRMNSDIPKQFIEVANKPIIIHTLEAFARHPGIDEILVVCLEEWIERLWGMVRKFNIPKVKYIVKGGSSGQLSCFNGLETLRDHLSDDDFVVIHDAIRPLMPEIIITELLRIAHEYGNACSSLPMHETLILTENQAFGSKSLDRDLVRRVQTPQAYRYGELYSVHKQALEKGITNSVYANTLMVDFGKTIYFSLGFDNNVKITTSEDLTLFKALLTMDERDLVKR
ncbi:MAG TPA: 2-C-methyl-D-erythritol 4-phosphate cytidylyltransferase [Firmicutes bacterium]|jgi:2-C-methyl-D-erythritol 4-phosphate cytidylyltransferase|nr:2-C-methyl-D-erythritol 4-phosphate cytidylyltransferase [Bacillota bacterium]